VLGGEKNAFRDAATMTAGAALLVAGKAADLKDGTVQAEAAIDSGAAEKVLARLAEVSNA
jgi:anthranilate phosphoribosyltransferase